MYKMVLEVTCIDFPMDERDPLTGYVLLNGNDGDVWDATFDGKDCTLLTYTGIKDKEGNELYDLDIVTDGEAEYIVFYQHGTWNFKDGSFKHWNVSTWMKNCTRLRSSLEPK
jgi:hypothetical protein